jgi:hypothetical protein
MPVILATWKAEIRISVKKPAQTINVQDPHLQNNQSKMGWRCDLRGRMPALQSPEFKPQSYQKTKTKKARICFCP